MFGDQSTSNAAYCVSVTENESDEKQREFTVRVFFEISKRCCSRPTCVVISVDDNIVTVEDE